jgi:hypothetical protein
MESRKRKAESSPENESSPKRPSGDYQMQGYDLRLKTPFRYIATGPSQAGKTTHIFNVLKDRHELFDVPTDNVIYYYNEWQDIFNMFNAEGIVKRWLNHLPTEEEVASICAPYKDSGGSVIVVDDFMLQLDKFMAKLFTVFSHHYRISVFLLTQNLFVQTPIYRTISLNTTYITCFRNPRDMSQINSLAKQIAPGKPQYIVASYREATRAPHSYMFFDFHQRTEDLIKVRSRILRKEFPMAVWLPGSMFE